MGVKENLKSIIGIILIGVLFIAASYAVQNNLDFFESYITDSFFSMVFYVFILIVSAVFAPIDMIFLMPIASAVWGWFLAAVLSLLGWTLGSSVVFVLSRKYGVPLIRKIISLKEIYGYEQLMPKENLFLGVVFLRIAIPIDLISYAIGIFTNMKFIPYFFATLIGFLPLAFFLAYIGTLPIYMQIIGFIIFLFVVIIGLFSIKHVKKNTVKKNY